MKPLVLLDVDGVVNDLTNRPGDHKVIRSNGYTIRIPEDIIIPVQRLYNTSELWWLTTWRERANDDIAPALGLPSLPVITDDSTDRWVGWKPNAAAPIVGGALDRGRMVYWIEDFYGDIPNTGVWRDDRITFIDTWGCLRPEHLALVQGHMDLTRG